MFPVGLAASTRINHRWSTHVGGFFTFTKALGDSNPADNEVKGVVVVDMLQLWGMLEYRASRVVARLASPLPIRFHATSPASSTCSSASSRPSLKPCDFFWTEVLIAVGRRSE